ncbi:tyrosine-type recombinase/integrase, partial [Peptoniphilus asaccharolyticus]
LSSIRTFFKYLSTKVDLIEYNPAEDIDSPKIERSLPVYLDLDEAMSILKEISNSNQQPKYKSRDYAIVTLFLNCGMRLSELSSLNLDDIKTNILRVTGKGRKQREIFLNNACRDALDEYLKFRPDIDDEALFLSMRNNRMNNRSIQHMVEKHIKNSGLDTNKYTVHKLRHTAATLMYQYGSADIRSLQEILGHESVSTTQIYTHVNNRALKETIENNPLSNINYNQNNENDKKDK